jgi:small-conductance mechanosensitive channel
MEIIRAFLDKAGGLIPAAAVTVIAVLLLMFVRYVINKRYRGTPDYQFRLHLILLLFSFVALLAIILVLPVSESTAGQLLSLIGLLLSAAIALSATTFVGNVMAGLMLRAVRNFRPGDFISVGEHFGRVSERGLFHVEIQTEFRDLTTLPNLYLVTNPVKVARSSGTLVIGEVSLSYDLSREAVKRALTAAAADAGLTEPFVHVAELGDYSVRYRVAGLLEDVKSLLSTRSLLRELMLDHLHRAGIEIVSPTFMNQRLLEPDRRFVPKEVAPARESVPTTELPEVVVFDKADEAESLEKLRARREALQTEIGNLKSRKEEAEDPAARKELDRVGEQLKEQLERLIAYIAVREKGDQSD